MFSIFNGQLWGYLLGQLESRTIHVYFKTIVPNLGPYTDGLLTAKGPRFRLVDYFQSER